MYISGGGGPLGTMSEANYLMKHIWLHVMLFINTYTLTTVMLCLEGEGAEHYDYK